MSSSKDRSMGDDQRILEADCSMEYWSLRSEELVGWSPCPINELHVRGRFSREIMHPGSAGNLRH
jgi:hypothetical protein